MYIKKLELQGFKSFPERTKIIFHKGITAIIGPNGTGKSNLVDGLLWVLSRKRSKSLRVERSGDIIFNGNAKKAPMSMADVVLTLGDDEEELVINHRVFRSGDNEYRLNGKTARLRDIQDALWKKTIGEAEYFVIEQGSVGLFLSSKPAEKRNLLEEAAGTAFYKDKKRQAHNKLNSTEQNLTRLQDIIAEVEKSKNSLKRQAQAAIRYRNLREDIRRLTVLQFRKKIARLEAEQTDTSRRYQTSLDQENEILSRMKQAEKALASLRQEVWRREKEGREERDRLFALKNRRSQLESERFKQSKRIDFIEDKKSGARRGREDLRRELKTLERENKKTEDTLTGLEGSLKRRRDDLAAAVREHQTSQDSWERAKQTIDSLRAEHLDKLSAQTEIKNERGKAEKEIELIQRQEIKLKDQIENERRLYLETEKNLRSAEKESERLHDELNSHKQRLEKEEHTAQSLRSVLEELNRKLGNLRHSRDETSHLLHSLQNLLSKEKDTNEAQELSGALGLFADLISSDSQHTPLVDVFWKDEVRANVIPASDFLKNLTGSSPHGRFLLLPDGEERETASQSACREAGGLGLLKANVKPAEGIQGRFSRLIEAAIVPDLRTAVGLWQQHTEANFITVDGDVLHASGLVVAGPQKEGLFALTQDMKSARVKLTGLEKEIVPVESEVETKTTARKESEVRIRRFREDIARLERTIVSRDKEKSYLAAEIAKISDRTQVFESETEVLTQDKKRMEASIRQVSTHLTELERERSALRSSIEEQETSLASLQEASEHTRTRCFELQSGLDLTEERIKNLKQQNRNILQRRENISSKIENLENELRSEEKEEAALKQDIFDLTQEAGKLERELRDKESEMLEKESGLKRHQEKQAESEQGLDEQRIKYEAIKEERVQWEIKKAERERDLVNLEETCWQELKKTIAEVKQEISAEDVADRDIAPQLEESQDKIQRFKAVNLMAEEEYRAQKERYDFLLQQNEDLRSSIDSTKEAIRRIDQESRHQFLKALSEVNTNFKDLFSLLFDGGHAEVKLTDPDQPLDSGIDIIAQPPGKRVQSLTLLSGGEKTLTSLAFFFALFRYKPTPFCILDEVDASLDEANLLRFLNLMKKNEDGTQFIIITHNFKSMEVADFIYGTAMPEPNFTNIYSVKMEKKETAEAEKPPVS